MGEAHTIFSFLLLFSFAETLIHIVFKANVVIAFSLSLLCRKEADVGSVEVQPTRNTFGHLSIKAL
jgi:hypothetical protein